MTSSKTRIWNWGLIVDKFDLAFWWFHIFIGPFFSNKWLNFSDEKWSNSQEINLGHEIEQIASSQNFFAIGTDVGEISLVSHWTLEMVVRWRAFQPSQPITALQFRGDQFLFSSGPNAGAELIIWNISKHTKGSFPKFFSLKIHFSRKI